MATWKKVVVSGSAAHLSEITSSGGITGSYGSSGSFGRVSAVTLDLSSIQGNWTNAGNTIADLGTVTTADINGGTVDAADVTVGSGKTLDVSGGTLTTSAAQKKAIVEGVGANTDIGAYELRAATFESDIATGTAPFTVASTTAVTNLQAATVATIAGLAPNTATTQATQGSITTAANLVTVGALDAGSITSGFTSIDVGSGYVSGSNIKGITGSFGHLVMGGDNFTSASLAAAIASDGDITSVVAGAGMTGTSLTGPIPTLNVIGGDGITANANDVAITAAQTTVTSVYNASLKLGRDSQNLIDFATTDNKLFFRANNINQVFLLDNVFGAVADSDVDLGTTGERWKDAYVDSVTVTDDVVVGGNLTVNGTTTTVASTNVEIADQFLFLASGSTGTNVDAGIIVQSSSFANSGSALYHDISQQRWAVAKSVKKTATAAQTHLQFVTTVKTSTSAPAATDADYGIGEMWIETDTQDVYIRTA